MSGEELLVGGELPDDVVAKLALYDNPAQRPPTAPILIVQGTADEAVPAGITEVLVQQINAQDQRQPERVVVIEGANHDDAVFQSTTLVADWIETKLR
jgi:pimeloyl-ACP methyl ester carboxylesterase